MAAMSLDFTKKSLAAGRPLLLKGRFVKRRFRLGAASLATVAILGLGCATAEVKTTAEATGPPPALTGAPIRAAEFILGTGDEILIDVYRHDDLRKTLTIDLAGKIMFPLVGDLQATGRSVFALRDEIAEKLSKYVVKPQVTISVTAIKSRKTLVLGEVRTPGYFVLDADLTVLDLISKAGGTTTEANLGKVLLIRKVDNKRTEQVLDLDKALTGADLSANIAVQGADIVFVPTKWIADVTRYFGYVSDILSPLVSLEGAIVLWPLAADVLSGNGGSNPSVTVPTK